MREVVTAVFDSTATADQAVRKLEDAGIPSTAIRRYHRDDVGRSYAPATDVDTTQTREERGGGFWAWLLGEEGTTSDRYQSYESDRNLYQRRVEAGNTVVAVTLDETDTDRVTDILETCNPVSLDEQVAGVGATSGTSAGAVGMQTQRSDTLNQQQRATRGTTEESIPLKEEEVDVDKRRVENPVRVRRYVVERPVEEAVSLRDERVEIERRKPVSGSAGTGAFEERTIEVRESHEEPVVNKTARVAEEAVVRRDVDERTEKVHDTARKEEVEVDRSGTKRP